MATLDLIESLSELRRRMSGLSFPEDYDNYIKTEREITELLRRLSTEKLDEVSIGALRSELPEVFVLGSAFRGFVLDLFERLGPPDEAMQELFRKTLEARGGDYRSPYCMATGEYIQLLKFLRSAGTPMPALVDPLRLLFESEWDSGHGPVSVQDMEMQLRAAALLLDRDGAEGLRAALDQRCGTASFRKRVVELMRAEDEWRMHGIATPGELQEIYSRLSGASAPFGQLVERFHERIRNGEKVLVCPRCEEYGVFVSYQGYPTEPVRRPVRCEQCDAELLLEIAEELQAPGHEEHARSRFTLRSAQ